LFGEFDDDLLFGVRGEVNGMQRRVCGAVLLLDRRDKATEKEPEIDARNPEPMVEELFLPNPEGERRGAKRRR
jgi:hypothetical protein